MRKIYLQEIIDYFGLNKYDLARKIFPGNKFPDSALNRSINCEQVLNADQIIILSEYIGVPIDKLFTFGGWEETITGKSNIQFVKGDITIAVDTRACKIQLYDMLSLEMTTYYTKEIIEVDELMEVIDDVVNKYKLKKAAKK